MMRKPLLVLGAAVLSCMVAVGVAQANDTELAYGGSPRMLKGHSTVSMRSEVVRMWIGKSSVKVDCRFVFKNTGPACTVRMGFPDEGGEFLNENGKLSSVFTSFRSYVDGQPLTTELVKGADGNTIWHAKMVSFRRGATRIVRDVYTAPLGGSVALEPVTMAEYILHTGSSWRGPIGRSTIIVAFSPGAITTPLHPVWVRDVGLDETGDDYTRAAQIMRRELKRPGTILYQGPSRPLVRGRTLRWRRTNWRPTEKDDIELQFKRL